MSRLKNCELLPFASFILPHVCTHVFTPLVGELQVPLLRAGALGLVDELVVVCANLGQQQLPLERTAC